MQLTRSVPRSAPVLLVLASLFGCDAPNEYVAPPPPKVTVSPPSREAVTEYLEFTGTTRAVATVEVRARVRGYLETVHFEEGQVVEKGKLLFTIDRDEFEIAEKQADAAVNDAQAAFDLAKAKAMRVKEAVEKKAVSVLEGLEADAQRDQARAMLERRNAELEKVQLDLSYTGISAPIAGRVGAKLVHEGNLVGSSENTLLTTIVQYSPIYADFDMSERHLLALRKKAGDDVKSPGEQLEKIKQIPLELGLANEDGYPHKGNIYYIDQTVDADTGTLLIRGVFQNVPVKILPGFFVRVRTPHLERPDALLVPERALGSDQGGRYVLVVDDENVVQHRRVVIGQRVGEQRVIDSGLKPEDRVIVNGMLRARPGGKVDPQSPGAAANPTATGTGS